MEHNKKEYNILLVDDDPLILMGIGEDIGEEGFNVTKAKSGEDAVDLLEEENFQLVITDLVMAGVDGIQVLKKAKEVNSETKVIILTGHGDLSTAIDALRLDADDFLLKPCDSEEIFYRVSRCLENYELTRKVKLYESILPVCAICKKIRDDSSTEPGKGNWMDPDKYIYKKSGLSLSHTYCPICYEKAMEDLDK